MEVRRLETQPEFEINEVLDAGEVIQCVSEIKSKPVASGFPLYKIGGREGVRGRTLELCGGLLSNQWEASVTAEELWQQQDNPSLM